MNRFYRTLLTHHVLANLLFVLVLVIGFLSYQLLPRQQDPTINFNWIMITTVLPGASAQDIEKSVTDPLEEAIRKIKDIRFISSNSRDNVSSMLVRFEEISERQFDKHLAELRREIQNTRDQLPVATENSQIWEITSGNAYPTASITVQGLSDDENLRKQAQFVQKNLERLSGVNRVDAVGLDDPEIQIEFSPQAMDKYQLSPLQIQQTLQTYFQDLALGSKEIGDKLWLIRLVGTESQASMIASWPIIDNRSHSEILVGDIAKVSRANKKADTKVIHNGKPAVLLSVMKQDNANNIELVSQLKEFIAQRNTLTSTTGVTLHLVDDQTLMTRNAISLMQTNALIGLFFVLLVAFFFLGTRIALLTAIGIPFILAGTFWYLSTIGETLNVTVLLGVVIVLGMLVDDAIVIVEAIYYRIERGENVMNASIAAIQEVALPVTTAVLTTIAAFLPLMLLPGILGDFMRVIPMVVTIALLISLVEAFWMLPTHMVTAKIRFSEHSKMHAFRQRLNHRIQRFYLGWLTKALRHPKRSLIIIFSLMLGSVLAVVTERIKIDFFAADTLRIFYVNIEMPSDTRLEKTLQQSQIVEKIIRQHIKADEVREIVSYAGLMHTEMEPMHGEQYAQIMIGLKAKNAHNRSVEEMIEDMRDDVTTVIGPLNTSFLKLTGGPPVTKPVSIKVRGDNYQQISRAVSQLRQIMHQQGDFIDISDDATAGKMELKLTLNKQKLHQLELSPSNIQQTLQLLIDGVIVSSMRYEGEKLAIRLKADASELPDIKSILDYQIPLTNGTMVALSELLNETRQLSLGNIRHYNFRRTITLEANLKKEGLNTVQANEWIVTQWNQMNSQYPNIDLDFTGELDDINESMDAIGVLFLLGVGLMYLLLGAQFRSYWQPFMILSTILMAFTGVVIGLLITQNPLSLYTLYGIVALAGIAVNASIVLISAANSRLKGGMSVLHATLFAAKRRVVPILITSMTTIAGLFSLASGLGGHSLIWGPVATAIVWGLLFSTVLTLFVIPLLYCSFMKSNIK